eukprot:1175738-Prorocentrum_minimum.AAC.2
MAALLMLVRSGDPPTNSLAVYSETRSLESVLGALLTTHPSAVALLTWREGAYTLHTVTVLVHGCIRERNTTYQVT